MDNFFHALFFHSFLDDRDFLSTIFFVSFVSAGHIQGVPKKMGLAIVNL